jgi:hypothetical protein
MDLEKERKKNDTFFKRWGAVFILLTFFLISWAGQFATQLATEKQQSEQHGQAFQMEEFWPQFWASTFENWQSEWLQLFTQALLISGFASYVFRKQDEEHYRTQTMIDELRQELTGKKTTI